MSNATSTWSADTNAMRNATFVTEEEINQAVELVPSEVLGALTVAAVRIESHHRRQLPKDDIYEDELGVG